MCHHPWIPYLPLAFASFIVSSSRLLSLPLWGGGVPSSVAAKRFERKYVVLSLISTEVLSNLGASFLPRTLRKTEDGENWEPYIGEPRNKRLWFLGFTAMQTTGKREQKRWLAFEGLVVNPLCFHSLLERPGGCKEEGWEQYMKHLSWHHTGVQ